MKTILLFSILCCSCAIVFPARGALTDADLDKIRLIVKDEVTAETAKINGKIDTLDARLRTVETDMTVTQTEITNLKGTFNNGFDDVQKNFDQKFESIEKNFDQKFESIEKNFDQKFGSIEKNFDRQNNIIIACIGIPLAILAMGATVWGILAHRRSGKDRALERQVEVLTQEIETLKQQQIVRP